MSLLAPLLACWGSGGGCHRLRLFVLLVICTKYPYLIIFVLIEVEAVLLPVLQLQEVVIKGFLANTNFGRRILEGEGVELVAFSQLLTHSVELTPPLDGQDDLADLPLLCAPGPLGHLCLSVNQGVRILTLGALSELELDAVGTLIVLRLQVFNWYLDRTCLTDVMRLRGLLLPEIANIDPCIHPSVLIRDHAVL